MICLNCEKKVFSEKETFAALTGGGRDARNNDYNEDYIGYLKFCWRALPQEGGRLLDVGLVKEEGSRGGQFEYYFCSIDCLRSYLNQHLDQLEELKEKYLKED